MAEISSPNSRNCRTAEHSCSRRFTSTQRRYLPQTQSQRDLFFPTRESQFIPLNTSPNLLWTSYFLLLNSISPIIHIGHMPLILTSPERSRYPQTKRTMSMHCIELNQSALLRLLYHAPLVHQEEGLLYPLETPQSLVLLVQSVRLIR
jgi:hypothetical protein